MSDDYSIAYLQDILVDPEFQRLGIGKQLIKAYLLRFARVRLKVLLTDDEARQQQFYESVGLRDTSSIDEFELHTFIKLDA